MANKYLMIIAHGYWLVSIHSFWKKCNCK